MLKVISLKKTRMKMTIKKFRIKIMMILMKRKKIRLRKTMQNNHKVMMH